MLLKSFRLEDTRTGCYVLQEREQDSIHEHKNQEIRSKLKSRKPSLDEIAGSPLVTFATPSKLSSDTTQGSTTSPSKFTESNSSEEGVFGVQSMISSEEDNDKLSPSMSDSDDEVDTASQADKDIRNQFRSAKEDFEKVLNPSDESTGVMIQIEETGRRDVPNHIDFDVKESKRSEPKNENVELGQKKQSQDHMYHIKALSEMRKYYVAVFHEISPNDKESMSVAMQKRAGKRFASAGTKTVGMDHSWFTNAQEMAKEGLRLCIQNGRYEEIKYFMKHALQKDVEFVIAPFIYDDKERKHVMPILEILVHWASKNNPIAYGYAVRLYRKNRLYQKLSVLNWIQYDRIKGFEIPLDWKFPNYDPAVRLHAFINYLFTYMFKDDHIGGVFVTLESMPYSIIEFVTACLWDFLHLSPINCTKVFIKLALIRSPWAEKLGKRLLDLIPHDSKLSKATFYDEFSIWNDIADLGRKRNARMVLKIAILSDRNLSYVGIPPFAFKQRFQRLKYCRERKNFVWGRESNFDVKSRRSSLPSFLHASKSNKGPFISLSSKCYHFPGSGLLYLPVFYSAKKFLEPWVKPIKPVVIKGWWEVNSKVLKKKINEGMSSNGSSKASQKDPSYIRRTSYVSETVVPEKEDQVEHKTTEIVKDDILTTSHSTTLDTIIATSSSAGASDSTVDSSSYSFPFEKTRPSPLATSTIPLIEFTSKLPGLLEHDIEEQKEKEREVIIEVGAEKEVVQEVVKKVEVENKVVQEVESTKEEVEKTTEEVEDLRRKDEKEKLERGVELQRCRAIVTKGLKELEFITIHKTNLEAIDKTQKKPKQKTGKKKTAWLTKNRITKYFKLRRLGPEAARYLKNQEEERNGLKLHRPRSLKSNKEIREHFLDYRRPMLREFELFLALPEETRKGLTYNPPIPTGMMSLKLFRLVPKAKFGKYVFDFCAIIKRTCKRSFQIHSQYKCSHDELIQLLIDEIVHKKNIQKLLDALEPKITSQKSGSVKLIQ